MDTQAAIEVSDLSKNFGATQALKDVSLTIEKGEILGLVGPNGAGKTTMMSCLLGIITPSAGSVLVDGKPPDAMDVHKKVGFVPERLNFTKWMSGLEFVRFHGELCGLSGTVLQERVEEVLRLVKLDENAWRRKIKGYSRGMLQRVGMAQALVGKPEFLFLDEPSSGLDPEGVSLFRKILRSRKELGCTMVINSHQLDELQRVCDRIVFVKKGQVELDEMLHSISPDKFELKVKWTDGISQNCSREKLEEIAANIGAKLVEYELPFAIFSTNGAEMNTELLQALGAVKLPVAEAVPLNRKLENLFQPEGDSE